MHVDTGRLRVVANEASEPVTVDMPEGRPSPGSYVREQRKRRGMSLEQLAAATKIPRGQLELLENDRFDELPGPVFVKGFLRCCARSLELEEDMVLGLLYEREREQLRARRRESTSPLPVTPSGGHEALGSGVYARVLGALSGVPIAKLLMWAIVALLVLVIVLVAFTLASGQLDGIMNS
jgi:cytoskeletal protein RodZ